MDKYKIGEWYWSLLQRKYRPIHDWMYIKGETNKIYYYVFSAIDIVVYIISYFIMWLCGYIIE